jgi:hypothetical protein
LPFAGYAPVTGGESPREKTGAYSAVPFAVTRRVAEGLVYTAGAPSALAADSCVEHGEQRR